MNKYFIILLLLYSNVTYSNIYCDEFLKNNKNITPIVFNKENTFYHEIQGEKLNFKYENSGGSCSTKRIGTVDNKGVFNPLYIENASDGEDMGGSYKAIKIDNKLFAVLFFNNKESSLLEVKKDKLILLCDLYNKIELDDSCSDYLTNTNLITEDESNEIHTKTYFSGAGCGSNEISLTTINQLLSESLNYLNNEEQEGLAWYFIVNNDKKYLIKSFFKDKEEVPYYIPVHNDKVYSVENNKIIKICSNNKKLKKIYKSR